MPAANLWASFFDVDLILSELHIDSDIKDLVEIGCGYGTFTVPSAKKSMVNFMLLILKMRCLNMSGKD
jgi:tRNA G46 methylase TrmB